MNSNSRVVILWFMIILPFGSFSYRFADQNACKYTLTTVSGSKAPTGRICKGQLLLNENFVEFDRDLWKHEVTLGGGGVSGK